MALFFCISFSFGQVPPKRELRAAWIATVTNIDWPLRNPNGTAKTPGEQQTDLLTLLDALQSVGINAVMFQIRSSCDAFYKSSIEPWSEWLTGTQGQAPNPEYDPLQFAIDACRARGMELHAWFNPYRAVANVNTSTIADNHVTKTKGYLIRDYMSNNIPIKVLDPGEPETRTYVTSVIMDVVRRYDIDAVHFDDYFYPYPVSGLAFPDAATYNTYGGGLPLGDWRRDNVNKLIKMISDSVIAVKPRVKFGISPFGIWKNYSLSEPLGSATSGLESYYAIYADTKKWLLEGWIDYVAPQIYWRFGFTAAKYEVLVPWWNDNSFSRQVFIGHAVHQVDPNGQKWPIKEIVDQVNLNRQFTNIKGSIHFSAKYFRANAKTLNDSLLRTVYTTRTLVPRMAWKDTIPPNTPDSLQIQRWPSYASITWKTPPPALDGELPQQYILYRSTSPSIDFNDMRNAVPRWTATSFVEFPLPPPGTAYYYAVTSLDKNQNESAPTPVSNPVVSVEREVLPPASIILYQNYPNPFNPSTIISFKVPSEQKVSLRVYDVLGREVKVLVDGVVGAGEHFAQFDGAGLSTGVYFYRFVAGAYMESKKMVLVR